MEDLERTEVNSRESERIAADRDRWNRFIERAEQIN